MAALRDYALPFRIEGQNVNGRVVKLNAVASEVLLRHDYPEAVNRLLGEALVLAAMLGTMLKFDGRFILQLQGSGPISMLMADYTPQKGVGGLRGFAQFDEAALADALKKMAISHRFWAIKRIWPLLSIKALIWNAIRALCRLKALIWPMRRLVILTAPSKSARR